MTILTPLVAFVGRFTGKILNMAFGWASTLLFGRVPQSKQLLLSGISLGCPGLGGGADRGRHPGGWHLHAGVDAPAGLGRRGLAAIADADPGARPAARDRICRARPAGPGGSAQRHGPGMGGAAGLSVCRGARAGPADHARGGPGPEGAQHSQGLDRRAHPGGGAARRLRSRGRRRRASIGRGRAGDRSRPGATGIGAAIPPAGGRRWLQRAAFGAGTALRPQERAPGSHVASIGHRHQRQARRRGSGAGRRSPRASPSRRPT